MSAKVLNIQAKNRTPANTVVKLEDFDYREGEAISLSSIVNSPNISLYCLDLQNQRAIFVETPIDVDLSQAPFYYLAQYEQAQRLIAVPLAELPQLLENIEPVEQLTIIYSVGRCGSTLLSKVFNRVDTVLSLSEPDVFSQIVGLRNPDRRNNREIAELLTACVYLLAKPTPQGKFDCCVIKLRSFAIALGDLIYLAFPNAKSIFLYRNAEDVVKSSIRSFVFLSKLLPAIAENIDLYSRFIPLLKEYADDIDFTDSQATDLYTVLWLSTMQSYLSLHQQGIITCAVRYEDLVAQPQQIVSSLFQECGLPITEVANGCEVFINDSQKGSNLSQENTRQDEVKAAEIPEIQSKIANLLQKHPEINISDFVAPNTLGHAK